MSAIGGAVGVSIALIAEEIVVKSAGGAGAVSGIFKGLASVVSKIADPNVAAIPNRADKKKG